MTEGLRAIVPRDVRVSEDDDSPRERRLFRGAVTTERARGTPKTESLAAAILAQARVDPDRSALESPDRALTYAEFESEAMRLAAALAGAGVRRGARVALLLDRSIEAAYAAVAIMLAGAACVPLDPAAPPDRCANVLSLTGCTVAVGRPTAAGASPVAGLTLVHPGAALDGPAPALPPVESDDAAFVVATAATGPLVAIAHGDVLALLGATRTLLDFRAGDRFALFHSLRTDLAIWELAACLTAGATGVVVSTHVAADAVAASALVARERITVLHQKPSSFRALAAAQAKAGHVWSALRWIAFTGEPIDRMTLRRFRANAGAAPASPRFANLYGVSEATIFSTFKLLEEAELAGELASPLGFPLAHQELVLHDERGTPVGTGLPGEIWIRGSGVATEYLGDPALSAGRFVRRATPDGPTRFFRTGDLARRRPNGEFEYMGRAGTPRTPDDGRREA